MTPVSGQNLISAKRIFVLAALFVLFSSSAALGQNNPYGDQRQRGEYSEPAIKPSITHPRANVTSSLNLAGFWGDNEGSIWALNQDQSGNITGSDIVPPSSSRLLKNYS
jgi:hypothetical protein